MILSYSEWKLFNESLKNELKCPHPEDKEFCEKWNLYIKGKGEMPIYNKKTPIGHYKGLKSRVFSNKKEKVVRDKGKKGGRHDWRKDLH